MAGDKIQAAAGKADEKPVEQKKEDKPLTTREEIVADAIADRGVKKESAFGPDEDVTDENAEAGDDKSKAKKSEASDAEPEPAAGEKDDEDEGDEESSEDEESDDEEADEEADDEEADEESEDDTPEVARVKASMQKRIDKLTAKLKAKEAKDKTTKPEEKKPDEGKKAPEYTREQLKAATKKFMEEGDSDGLFEVMEYMTDKKAKDLKNEYIQEQNKVKEAAQAKEREWQSVVRHYSNDEDPTLDIRKSNSTLFKVAKKFYEDPELGPLYLLPGGGGMLQAVADALAEILKFRADKGAGDKKPIVKAKAAKERRKSAMGGTGSMRQEGSPKKGSGSEIEDYLADRKAAIAAKKGTPIGD